MRCAICSHPNTRVVDSRLTNESTCIRRRRECDKCGYRFSTLEEVELLGFTVVKRDARRESYSRDKMIRGLKKGLEKRPYTEDAFYKLVSKIERDILKKKHGELTSQELGEIVMKHLKTFDKVAYIRFASVYRSFEDVKTFEEALRELIGKKKQRRRSK